MITASLIAHGFEPRTVYRMLDEYVNMRLNEEETLDRYGVKQSPSAQVNLNIAIDMMSAIDEEIHIATTPRGKPRTGLS